MQSSANIHCKVSLLKNDSTTVGTGQHLSGNGSHGWGYAYYGEVWLGHLFILALLGYVMGHMC